jgi:hypothetical protein
MSREIEIKEFKTFAKAFYSLAPMLWRVFPIHVLGWLVSAIARHPSVETELKPESVYAFILFWQGGANLMPVVVLLILILSALFVIYWFLRKLGYSEPVDGMVQGRIIMRKYLIPYSLSAAAFSCGVISGGTLKGFIASYLLLSIIALFAWFFLYLADTTED